MTFPIDDDEEVSSDLKWSCTELKIPRESLMAGSASGALDTAVNMWTSPVLQRTLYWGGLSAHPQRKMAYLLHITSFVE